MAHSLQTISCMWSRFHLQHDLGQLGSKEYLNVKADRDYKSGMNLGLLLLKR